MADAHIEQNRVCRKCGEAKPRQDFQKNVNMKEGVTWTCRKCAAARAKSCYHNNPEYRQRAKEHAARRRLEKPAEVSASKAKWRQRNLDKCRAFHDKWALANPEKLKDTLKRAREKRRGTVRGRICASISEGVRASLKKGGKCGTKSFDILGYSQSDLMRHLESKFTDGMSWENYGQNGWHIDHIIPLSAFNFQSVEHVDFKLAWALSNLQPLWAHDNISKGAKLNGPFQPSLAL